MFVQLALVALIAEAAFGYSDMLYRRIGHPVTWFGALIARCETAWNRPAFSPGLRRFGGIGHVVVLLAVSIGAGLAIWWGLAGCLAQWLPDWAALALGGLFAGTLLAQRSLHDHVRAVAEGLEHGGLDAGRTAVALIVGRDPQSLDQAGVARASIESLAENFSDGVVAPVLWLAVGGLPGALAYKAVNTADSMIGHRSERYAAFGWAAARLDDLLNLPASRLSALWLILAAAILPDASATGAARAVWHDAGRHTSPNAGWPEAAVAGALGLRLAGPRSYRGEVVAANWMGTGRAEAGASDIRRALRLYRVACLLQGLALAILVIASMVMAGL